MTPPLGVVTGLALCKFPRTGDADREPSGESVDDAGDGTAGRLVLGTGKVPRGSAIFSVRGETAPC
jgi:hypothetical protein